MNTEFFGKANDMTSGFSWKDIFSDVFEKHTREQRMKVLSRGMAGNIPERSRMLDEWQKPWMFLRIAAVAVVLSVFSQFMLNGIIGGRGFASLLPAFAIPLSILCFYWEMNISGDISLLEVLVLMLVGGMFSLAITLLIDMLVSPPALASLSAPVPEEIAKFVVILIIMSREKYRYGLQGIVVGGAVGAGFAAIESAGYALEKYEGSASLEAAKAVMMNVHVVRGLLAAGGHAVWAALYGGALGLAKHGKKKYAAADLKDPLVTMTFSAAVVLHSFWNTDAENFVIAEVFPKGLFVFLNRLESLLINYIILIVLAWILLLFIMRKCIRQMVAVGREAAIAVLPPFPVAQQKVYHQAVSPGKPLPESRQAASPVQLTVTAVGKLNAGKSYGLNRSSRLVFGRDPARANVLVPSNARGVSALHCEIKQMGEYPVLIDLGSTYGTFFANGKKLNANVPYKIKGEVWFYLGAKENMFRIRLQYQGRI